MKNKIFELYKDKSLTEFLEFKRDNPKVFSKFKKLANNMIDIKPNMPVTIILSFIYFIYCLIITILFNYYLY